MEKESVDTAVCVELDGCWFESLYGVFLYTYLLLCLNIAQTSKFHVLLLSFS